jgi:uncharacterized damage-inducible protein DinB
MFQSSQADQIKTELLRDVAVRLFDENTERIKKCLHKLSVQQIWWRPNQNSNSIGNLILHLDGNVRQWILSGLNNQQDIRKRQMEFDHTEPLDHTALLSIIDVLEFDIRDALTRIKTEDLLKKHPVQVYEETGISILIHVTEHFSYHTGQIAFITKMLLDEQVSFYAHVDLG